MTIKSSVVPPDHAAAGVRRSLSKAASFFWIFCEPASSSCPSALKGSEHGNFFCRLQPCTDSSWSPSVIFSPAVGLLLVFPPELPLNATIQHGSVTWSRISPPDPNRSAEASQKCYSTFISVHVIQQKNRAHKTIKNQKREGQSGVSATYQYLYMLNLVYAVKYHIFASWK